MGTAIRPTAHEGERLASALGWLSLGLGAAELMAPRTVARWIGVDSGRRSHVVVRAMGAREVASGVGLLARPRPVRWAWARLAGDVMDLILLRAALARRGRRRMRVGAAAATVLGIAALDALCVQRITRADGATARSRRVSRSITINRPPEEVYRFWRDLENLPRVARHLESVTVTSERRSHWRARGPAGTTIEWDAEIVEDRPNEMIAWRSVDRADVDNAGTVRFRPAPGGRGTEVTVELQYAPPGGAMSAAVAKLFREEPGQQVQDDLRALKQVLETGEVLVSDATVRRGPHPAQPPAVQAGA
jgi:uncharacterized membrane protein